MNKKSIQQINFHTHEMDDQRRRMSSLIASENMHSNNQKLGRWKMLSEWQSTILTILNSKSKLCYDEKAFAGKSHSQRGQQPTNNADITKSLQSVF